eukprot:3828755-Rhodomonas_salina.1
MPAISTTPCAVPAIGEYRKLVPACVAACPRSVPLSVQYLSLRQYQRARSSISPASVPGAAACRLGPTRRMTQKGSRDTLSSRASF